jgi:predicted transcriptional regulator
LERRDAFAEYKHADVLKFSCQICISCEDYQKRTIAIAKGEYRPKPGGPKICFESLQAFAQVLSTENQALLKIIRQSD